MANDLIPATPSLLNVGTFEELNRLSELIVKAGGMIPAHLKTAGHVAAVVLAGQELGLGPMAAMRGMHLVEGRVTMDQSLVLALIHRAGIKSQWPVSTAKQATLVLTRGVEKHTETFTIEDAQQADLSGKNVWKRYPKAMLRARAVTAAARAFCPEVFFGSVYTAEELGADDAGPTVRVEVGEAPAASQAPQKTDVVDAEIVEETQAAKEPTISAPEAKLLTEALFAYFQMSTPATDEQRNLAKAWLTEHAGVTRTVMVPQSKLTELLALLDGKTSAA